MSIVDDIFHRISFDEIDRTINTESYRAIKQIAKVMDGLAPDCYEKTLAFHALHMALMHFGTALTKQDKYKSE